VNFYNSIKTSLTIRGADTCSATGPEEVDFAEHVQAETLVTSIGYQCMHEFMKELAYV
jgi:hypothetical protein